MFWYSPMPMHDTPSDQRADQPTWYLLHIYGVTDLARRIGYCITDPYSEAAESRWRTVRSAVVLMPISDMHLLKHIGHSLGGTSFPWYVVKGLNKIRDESNWERYQACDDEEENAEFSRQQAIDERQENEAYLSGGHSLRKNEVPQNPGSRRAEDAGLITYYKDCGLITGRRTPLSPHLQVLKHKAKAVPKPQYLEAWLARSRRAKELFAEEDGRARIIAESRRLESVISGEPELIEPHSPLTSPVLEQLDKVWRERIRVDVDNTEDEMNVVLQRWRESKKTSNPGDRSAANTHTRIENVQSILPTLHTTGGSENDANTAMTGYQCFQTEVLR
ncbi:MAG: hypothetical protein LQ346_003497 [Caloplaca aetnensis]|nr:MAG: hypothetical protein LQ346_003497 [Caloplaca aetnensis]